MILDSNRKGDILLKIFKLFFEQSPQCHTELIRLFISNSYKSSIAYISSLLLYIWLFYTFIPLNVLLPWIAIHILYQVTRFYFLYRYKDKELSLALKHKFLMQHTILMFVGGMTWGVGSVLCVLYAPTPYEYLVLALILGMSAGSIATVSSLFRVFIAYNLPMLLFLIATFIYQTDVLHFYIAFMIILFTIIVISSASSMYATLKQSIELQELYSESQKELKEFNKTLEEKVAKEVEYNRQKDQQMLEQSRLAQMGEMISMIAHQWRQPLSAITATTGTMTLKIQLDELNNEEIEEDINRINTYVQYLSTTISDFRNFFKPDKEKHITSLHEIVHRSIQIIGTLLENEKIILELFLESKTEFTSYPNELQQVVINLLKNAKDVFNEKEIDAPRILIKTVTLKNEVQLSVSDNAGGIPEKNVHSIFDPYFTTKAKSDGTGLGLYMSKLIVEDHCSGRLEVKNLDEGACFTLTLPIV
jgi:signal transduction histidine kinase